MYTPQGDFVTKFVTIAELCCRKQWFAVRNLVRRQLVPKSEFLRTFGDKTAVEWAAYYKEEAMANELEYYVRRNV
jgi:hypothetical protein